MAEMWASPLPREPFPFPLIYLYTRQMKHAGAKHSVAILP